MKEEPDSFFIPEKDDSENDFIEEEPKHKTRRSKRKEPNTKRSPVIKKQKLDEFSWIPINKSEIEVNIPENVT